MRWGVCLVLLLHTYTAWRAMKGTLQTPKHPTSKIPQAETKRIVSKRNSKLNCAFVFLLVFLTMIRCVCRYRVSGKLYAQERKMFDAATIFFYEAFINSLV